MIEEWKAIPNYEGFYEVSTFGNVRSVYCYRRQLKPMLSPNGYLYVDLFKHKNRKHFAVHRLVAMTFIDNPENKPEINHKDECKTNNHLENLEWVTRLENVRYGTGIARRTENTNYKRMKRNVEAQIKAVSKPIAQFTKDGEYIATWKSASDFCRKNNHPQGIAQVRRCCTGKSKTAFGFIFRDLEGSDDLSARLSA